MRDPLSDVLKYVTQPPFRPIPTDGKQALKGWAQYQRRAPEAYERHRWWPTKRKNHYNVALICGPACGILVLNMNIKGGKDGRKHLKGPIDNAPTIQTPSGGVAYCFRPPDPARYPSEFRTHVYPKGYDGLDFAESAAFSSSHPAASASTATNFCHPGPLSTCSGIWRTCRIGCLKPGWPSMPAKILAAIEHETAAMLANPHQHRHRQPTSLTLTAHPDCNRNRPNDHRPRRPQNPPAPRRPCPPLHYYNYSTNP